MKCDTCGLTTAGNHRSLDLVQKLPSKQRQAKQAGKKVHGELNILRVNAVK
jgi:hypothetical protein